LKLKASVNTFFLEDPGADNLTRHGDEHFVFARGENVNLCNLRFLVKLLCSKLDCLARPMVLGLLQSGFEKHLAQQIRLVEILRVAFEESNSSEFRLLRVQILRLRKLEQRAEVIGLRRVNDDDAFALLELIDDVVAVERDRRTEDRRGVDASISQNPRSKDPKNFKFPNPNCRALA